MRHALGPICSIQYTCCPCALPSRCGNRRRDLEPLKSFSTRSFHEDFLNLAQIAHNYASGTGVINFNEGKWLR